jgi:hypothetical protein
MSVTPLPGNSSGSRGLPGGVDSSGGPPHDEAMLKRLEKLEVDFAAVKTDLAVIRANYATKEDLHKEISTQTWKLVTFVCGFGTALVGATYFLATHVK